MEYITHRRFKKKAICGEVNLPARTKVENIHGALCYQGKMICYETSENAHQYFARNDDGNGMARGKLTQSIQKKLAQKDGGHQARWNRVWEDEVCRKYKRPEHEDYWLWSHRFFNADMETLRHIAALVGAKEG